MNDKLIVALDYATEQDAMALVNQLGDAVSYYKVGLELFLNTRGSVVDLIKAQNKKVFLDLKFHDIPNTVAQAVAWAASLGVDMFTLHSSGGEEMMRKSVETVNEVCERLNIKRPNMVGVTILTSFDEEGIAKVGYKNNIADTVLNLAGLCKTSGMSGIVCSPHEAANIKETYGSDFITVCPGIRPAWAAAGDQKRITTPADAIRIGVDHMVVGRPITKAENPHEAALKIIEEINSAMK
ncbi:MAG: orotidine-5'-phosphate decarboxylase [Peptococcaceae bacterium]|nr:orotidine-5'-phosphate decarboxylase [Peptococcaceae bacterium]